MSIDSYNGGTVLAMTGDKCFTMATDLRLGTQMLTISNQKSKVYKMGDRLYLGIAGLATDAQSIVEQMTFRKNLYELRENRAVKPDIFCTMVSNYLYEKRFGPYFSEPIIAGFDPVTYKPRVFGMDLIGCITNPADFVCAGTGEGMLFGICEAAWEPDMDPERLFLTTAQSFLSMLERDAASGWGALVYLVTPDKVSIRTLRARLD